MPSASEKVWSCLVDGGVFGTFIDWRGYPSVHAAAIAIGLDPLNLIVWSKTNAGMGSLYRSSQKPPFSRPAAACRLKVGLELARSEFLRGRPAQPSWRP